MNIKSLLKPYLAIAMIACLHFSAHAFDATKYAANSKLANGKWVKIEIERNGMHQLTFDQLAQMGFSNPEKVRVYGQGGYLLSEKLDGTATDDLIAVPIGMSNNKIYFYAKGTTSFELSPSSSARYTRTINTYATKSYYFITEEDGNANLVKDYSSTAIWGINLRDTSLDYAYHEVDQMSYGLSGRDFFGESIAPEQVFDVNMYGVSADTPIMVQCAIGAKASANTTMKCLLNDEEIPFSSTITTPSSYESFRSFSSYASITAKADVDKYKLTVGTTEPDNIVSAYLDYYIITYYHKNELNGRAQMFMGFNNLDTYDKVGIYDDSNALQVWDISNKTTPKRIPLKTRTESVYDEDLEIDISVTINEFTYGSTGKGEFIAFNPEEDLYKITSYEPIENQNIHSQPTPDYVIICPKQLLPQAERLAQFHRDTDGMDVFVVDQQKVFNEFSSGTPDATAYRLMLKMFYDRNPEKLKYLLMFGGGYFDNRQLLRNKGENYLLTFQGPNSSNFVLTYVSDDYFGMLDDNSGSNITSDILRLGVGRLPVISTEEASDIVDKIIAYEKSTDYGNWHNKMLIMDEVGDDDIHTYQATKLESLISETDAHNIDIKRLHIKAYTLVESSTNPVYAKGANNVYAANLQLANFFKEGMFFATYMGHGSYNSLSRQLIWKTADVKNTAISRLPILSIAACDIANYDSNTRGIGEYMIITPGHGCIALLTSTRSVEASENDQLNRAFIKALFSLNDDGSERTLGQAYMLAKQSYGSTPSRNKMCYTLFADPALKLSYAKPQIKVNSIDGKSTGDEVTLKPMTRVTIEGVINNADGTIDTDFNGDITASLLDAEQFYRSITYEEETLDVYHNRPLLSESGAKVTNGTFSITMLIPKNCTAGSTGIIKLYAHTADGKKMVNESINDLPFAEYDETDEATIIDNQAPIIDKMYINDESAFANDMNVPANFTLFVSASDDTAFSNPSLTIGKQITLLLDGVTYYDEVRGFTTTHDNGATLTIAMPMTAMKEGQHTLKITLSDAAGNSASQTISFIVVNEQSEATLDIDNTIASDKVTFSLTHKFATEPSVKIYVTDLRNKVVWSKTVDTFPYGWNLTDNDGQRLPAGVYQFFGTATSNSQSAGTAISKLTIIEP
ncbi:MAG: type IX secretion system sortase PorU [Muribaculaceae bacterium]